MKISTKLLLILPLILSSYQKTYTGLFSNNNHKFDQTYQLLGPLIAIEQSIKFKNKLQKAADAPEIIKDFCYEKLKAQNFKDGTVQIKVVNGEWLASFGTNYIILGFSASYELKKALENPTDKDSIKILKVYSVFIDHEIYHLKNNDAPIKRLSFFTGINLISLGITSYIINASRYRSLFQTNAKSRILMGLVTQIFSLFAYTQYSQFQEKKADAYATSLSNDSESLYLTANLLKKNEDNLIHLLSDAKFNTFAPINSLMMVILQKVFFTCYRIKKPKEDFHSWVKKQSLTSPIIRLLHDMEHPSGFSRAESMLKAADVLNSQI